MNARRSIAVDASACSGPVTPLRAVLVGEHPTRTLAQLQVRARSDGQGRLVLDMEFEEARNLVRCLDAWCDREDATRDRLQRDRSAPLTSFSEPPSGTWHQKTRRSTR